MRKKSSADDKAAENLSRTNIVKVTVDDSLHRQIRVAAALERITGSEFARRAIEKAAKLVLDKHGLDASKL